MYRKTKKEFKIINSLLFILVSIFFVGCFTGEAIDTSVPNEDDSIVMVTELPETLKSGSSDLVVSLFEGLVRITDNNKVGPALSKGWKISNDGIDYEFLLNDDIKWSNGEKITAKDFENFFKSLLSKNNLDFDCKDMYSIYGVEEYKKGLRDFSEVAIKAEKENVLKIRLNNKDDDFLKKLTKVEYRLRKLSEPLELYKTEFSQISYTGAYLIENIEEDGAIILTSNSNYVLVRENNKKVKLIQSQSEEQNLANYTLGKIDILQNPSVSVFKEGTLKNNINKSESKKMVFMIMNTKYGATEYLDFRKGIYSSLNYSLINSYIMKNGLGYLDFKEISSDEIEKNEIMKSSYIKEYNEDFIKINENKAKDFFSIIPTGVKKEITIVAENSFENKETCEFIKEELKKYSITTKVNLFSKENLESELEKKKFNIYIDSINLNKEDMESYVNQLKGTFEDGYSIFSMYRKYNIWCKSNEIKKLYIDSNGNIILKNTNI